MTDYVCYCNCVTEREIELAVSLGITSEQELSETLGVAANCGRCDSRAREVLRRAMSGRRHSDPAAG